MSKNLLNEHFKEKQRCKLDNKTEFVTYKKLGLIMIIVSPI